MREHLAEGARRLTELLALPAAQPRTALRARALFGAGVLTGARGQYAPAIGSPGERGDPARAGRRAELRRALNALAVTAQKQGDLGGARPLFEESLELWRKLGIDSPSHAP